MDVIPDVFQVLILFLVTEVADALLSGSFFFSPAVEMDLSAETTTDADAVAAETTAAG